MPSFVRCVSILGFDGCVVCQVACTHNKLIPMIGGQVECRSHSECFTHECPMNMFNTVIVSRRTVYGAVNDCMSLARGATLEVQHI